MEVRIVNRNKFALPGRYAAVDYQFPPGKPVAISRVAADHIFGLREQNKTRALNCLGILKVGVTYQEALAVLANVSFEEGRMVYETGSEEPRPEPDPQGPEGPMPPAPSPAQDEEEEEEDTKESGGRPGAPRSPGRKSEVGAITPPASDDSAPGRRQW